jgi:hypothetical protein
MGSATCARAEDGGGDFSVVDVDPHGATVTWSVPIAVARDGR